MTETGVDENHEIKLRGRSEKLSDLSFRFFRVSRLLSGSTSEDEEIICGDRLTFFNRIKRLD